MTQAEKDALEELERRKSMMNKKHKRLYQLAIRKREINHTPPETPKNHYIRWHFVNRHMLETLKKKRAFFGPFLSGAKNDVF